MATLFHAMKPTLFISDLHLSPADPATAAAFHVFLANTAPGAAALYILGDLFEYWIGDDQLDDAFFAEQAATIRQLVGRGVPVFFLPGNRDFLPSRRFAAASGAALLADPSVISLNQQPVLIAHGDAYCTDDAQYQRFRRIVRHPLTQWLWFAMPRFWRQRKAAALREQSRRQGPRKAEYLMDVNVGAVGAAMRAAGVNTLIHGHTHRPARHEHREGIRWVLPDWKNGAGGYLRQDENGLILLDLNHLALKA